MSNDTPLTMERLQHLTYAASVSACMKPEFLKGLAETHPSALIRALAAELATLRERLAAAEEKVADSRTAWAVKNLEWQGAKERARNAEQRAERAERDAGLFDYLQNIPVVEAQQYFWNYSSRKERAKAIAADKAERDAARKP